MGGRVNQPTGFETELDNLQELARGFKGYLVTTPKGKTIVVEEKSGAIIGDTIANVRKDIMTCDDILLMEKQVEKACREQEKVLVISEEEFWEAYGGW